MLSWYDPTLKRRRRGDLGPGHGSRCFQFRVGGWASWRLESFLISQCTWICPKWTPKKSKKQQLILLWSTNISHILGPLTFSWFNVGDCLRQFFVAQSWGATIFKRWSSEKALLALSGVLSTGHDLRRSLVLLVEYGNPKKTLNRFSQLTRNQ